MSRHHRWWLDAGKEDARCRAMRGDFSYPGRCKMRARVDGYCKLHRKMLVAKASAEVHADPATRQFLIKLAGR